MARQATGQIIAYDGADGRTYSLRFRAYGKRRRVPLGAVTEAEAEQRLRHILADVERGTWAPESRIAAPAAPGADIRFDEFAVMWWREKRGQVGINTRTDYEWQIDQHLMPFFGRHMLSEITVAEVDRYRAHKVGERERREMAIAAANAEADDLQRIGKLKAARAITGLSAASINKTITRLGQILEVADERGLINRNPVKVNPRNRKLKVFRPAAVYLDRADQIEALLAAATELDHRARPDRRHVPRRTMLAVLVYGGLRISEALSLRWRDLDLATGRLYVADAKTVAGVRHVELLPALRDELIAHKATKRAVDPDALVFATTNGRKFSRDGFRQRVFANAVALADERRVSVDLPPLPEKLTVHKLRHTCCSLLFALGWDQPRVMEQLGHADGSVTLRVYGHVMKATENEREKLRELVGCELIGPTMGQNGLEALGAIAERDAA